MNILSKIWPNGIFTPTPRIDIWTMDLDHQAFGYWTNGIKAGPNHPPEKLVTIPIQQGDLQYRPTPEVFFNWLGECVHKPELFTKENYDCKFRDQ